MKFIEILRKIIPSLAIIAYVSLLHFRQPEISDAIVALGLFALFGFESYIRIQEQPDFRKEIKKEFSEDLSKLAKEITDTKSEVSKLSMSSTTGGRGGKIQF